MAYEFELTDDTGRRVASCWLGEHDRSYVMPDGRRCPMPQAVAWCRDCGGFVAAERVPSPARVDEMLAAVRGEPDAVRRQLAALGQRVPETWSDKRVDGFAQYLREYWGAVAAWRPLRASPPRCLDCTSTAVDLVPEGADDTTDPVSGRRVRIEGTAHLKMAYHWEYSVEGLPLEKRPRGR